VVKGLKEVIEQQELFAKQMRLTLLFLKIYSGNPLSFKLIIGTDIWSQYKFNRGMINPRWMLRCIDEMTFDMVHKEKFFEISYNDLFSTVTFSKKKNEKILKEIEEELMPYSKGKWEV